MVTKTVILQSKKEIQTGEFFMQNVCSKKLLENKYIKRKAL